MSIIFCVFMSIRQIIYILVYFLSQKKLRIIAISYLTCKNKRNKSKGKILKSINLDDNSINNDDIEDK